jgi:hypothetical protein
LPRLEQNSRAISSHADQLSGLLIAALLDEMILDKAQHYLIKDMDTHLQHKPRKRGIQALPESAFPQKWRGIQNHSQHTPYWHFSFTFHWRNEAGGRVPGRHWL